MAATTSARSRVIFALRWIARIGSVLFAIGVGSLFGYGVYTLIARGAGELITIVGLAVAFVALILALFQEFWGGALLVLVGVAALINEIMGGVMDAGPFTFMALGALFLVCWWASRPAAMVTWSAQ